MDPYEKLCYYDKRNPFYNADDDIAPRDGCACDNCFYGRDQMALEMIRLREELENIANVAWTKWEAPMNTPTEFVRWAQNRARHTLSA